MARQNNDDFGPVDFNSHPPVYTIGRSSVQTLTVLSKPACILVAPYYLYSTTPYVRRFRLSLARPPMLLRHAAVGKLYGPVTECYPRSGVVLARGSGEPESSRRTLCRGMGATIGNGGQERLLV
jgi:hypothetical protein